MTELSAMDNLALSRGFARTGSATIRWREQEQTRSRAHRPVRPGHRRPPAPDRSATPVERTIVAIAAALQGWEGGRGVLVLDEPTAVLPHTEVDKLLGDRAGGPAQRHERPLRLAPHGRDLRPRRPRHRPARRPAHRHARRRATSHRRRLATLMVGEDVDISVRRRGVARRREARSSRSAICALGVLRGVSFDARTRARCSASPACPGPAARRCRTPSPARGSGAVSGALRLPAQSDAWIDLAR